MFYIVLALKGLTKGILTEIFEYFFPKVLREIHVCVCRSILVEVFINGMNWGGSIFYRLFHRVAFLQKP